MKGVIPLNRIINLQIVYTWTKNLQIVYMNKVFKWSKDRTGYAGQLPSQYLRQKWKVCNSRNDFCHKLKYLGPPPYPKIPSNGTFQMVLDTSTEICLRSPMSFSSYLKMCVVPRLNLKLDFFFFPDPDFLVSCFFGSLPFVPCILMNTWEHKINDELFFSIYLITLF